MHQVRYFLAVAEHLNFTRAAEMMHVAQPSLTRAIQKLEEELGGPLFRRERANTHLTELGRMMCPHLKATLEAAETAKRQAQSFRKRESGQLSIGACSTICAETAIRYLIEVAEEIPALDMKLEIRSGQEVEKSLIAGDIDAAILAPMGDFQEERFDGHLIRRDPFVVVFADGHRFHEQTHITLDELDSEPLIVRLSCVHEDAFAAAMEARSLNRVVRHRSSDDRWLIELVRAGLGCLILPKPTAEARGLPYAVLSDLPIEHRVTLTTVAGRRHSPALASLLKRIGAINTLNGGGASAGAPRVMAAEVFGAP